MKVLLDENLDHAVRHLLHAYEVMTVRYAGWAGVKNGNLLTKAENAGFDVLLTGDQTLQFEQNLTGRQIAVVVVSTIKTESIAAAIARVIQAIKESQPGQVTFVLCGTFDRKSKY